jgi:hypothetical protein
LEFEWFIIFNQIGNFITNQGINQLKDGIIQNKHLKEIHLSGKTLNLILDIDNDNVYDDLIFEKIFNYNYSIKLFDFGCEISSIDYVSKRNRNIFSFVFYNFNLNFDFCFVFHVQIKENI